LSFELCAKRILNYSILNCDLANSKLKIAKGDNSKLKTQNSKFPMGAIHFTEMLRLLDRAYQYRSLVDIYAWEGGTGEVIHYKGWLVHHVNWRGGYVRLRNPKARGNRLLRTVPQVFIFRINNQQVYL
jgi:hypothetical protein